MLGWGVTGKAQPVAPSHARLERYRESLCRAWLGTTPCFRQRWSTVTSKGEAQMAAGEITGSAKGTWLP
jgi:hypothetical protein